MRSEIETLLADAQRGWKGLHCSREFADRLQAILDADPVAKIEALGFTVVLTGEAGGQSQ